MKALFDSNVLIAELVKDHVHHDPSHQAFDTIGDDAIVIAAHSIAECYSQMTRPFPRGFALDATAAAQALSYFGLRIDVRTLTSAQLAHSLSQFAQLGGRGPRLYDFLIGQVAALNAIRTIVTWSTSHFTPLFPQLRIVTPTELLETL